MIRSNQELPADLPRTWGCLPGTVETYKRVLSTSRVFPVPIYAGKAANIRNRNQAHKRLDRLFDLLDDDEFDCDWTFFLAVWYIETENERRLAESTLIRRDRLTAPALFFTP